MKRRLFRRCGHTPGPFSSEDQVVVDAYRAMLAALRDPELWTPGSAQDVALRVGPFVERAHPRPGDDHGPDLIAVALIHPDTPQAAAYLQGRKLGYTGRGWLRCETAAILGVWQPVYATLTHAAAGLDLPDDVGMPPAHYGIHVEARCEDDTSHTLLRLGPYTQTRHAEYDVRFLNAELEGRAAPGESRFTARAVGAPFDVSSHESYSDPYANDAAELLAVAVEGARA
ncbi:hypothetical protein OG453_44580 [Streptomyces sp. NBC_01381]|uniref:hypothetical protein n=1 Tax=Streptomyces sp. NBC_01381 TaxID=2903845 RepID=UPI0022541A2E|nr:hypothetical protein [Streptomyces sp. NBC_01381]MCX4673636.1 hypothetical protein [Streptomyces sp. NBC_01381]